MVENIEEAMLKQMIRDRMRPKRTWVYILIALGVVVLLAYQFVPEFRDIVNPGLPVKKLYLVASVYQGSIGGDTTACMEGCPTPLMTHYECPVTYRFKVTVTDPGMNVNEWSREFKVMTNPQVGCTRPYYESGHGYVKFSILRPKKGSYSFDIKLQRKGPLGIWYGVGNTYVTYEVI